jgi:HEAT repeat protein
MYAVSALGDLGDATAVPYLLVCLGDADARIRSSAAYSLGQLKAIEAVEPLIAALGDPSCTYHSSAAMALGMIGDARAFEPLVALFERESDQHEAGSAIAGLGDLGDRRAIPLLLTCVSDTRLFVALAAIKALGKLKDPSVVEPLCAFIGGAGATHDHINAAATALAAIGDPRAITVLRGVSTGRPEPLFARGRLGDITAQGELRDHTDGAIRFQAWGDWQARESCIALGACGDATDISRLETLARQGDRKMRAAAED